MSIQMAQIVAPEYKITFHLPVYRQCRADIDLYVGQMIESRKAGSKKKVIDTPLDYFDAEKLASERVYKDDNGCYFPTHQFKAALVEAARRFKDPQGGRNNAGQRIKAGVKMVVDRVYLDKNYTVYKYLTVNKQYGNALVPTALPEYRDVDITVPMLVLDEFISQEFLRNVCQVACMMFGFGSGRPECGTGPMISFENKL